MSIQGLLLGHPYIMSHSGGVGTVWRNVTEELYYDENSDKSLTGGGGS